MTGKGRLKVATSLQAARYFQTDREKVLMSCVGDLSDVAVIVLISEEVDSDATPLRCGLSENIPVFGLVIDKFKEEDSRYEKLLGGRHVGTGRMVNLSKELECTAQWYENEILPPFFKVLAEYLSRDNLTFACPGHQGSSFLSKHPAGQKFLDFFGHNLFKADVPHADPMLGDLLSHFGPPGEAQQHAASVFNADKTYFVLNGTSSSNKIVANALLTKGDVVLFDRNNHKSCYHGALIQAGATPVYLEAMRNAYGVIGGVPAHCFDECYLRARLKEVAPEKAEEDRPFRLAILQSGTWDGSVYNVKQVVGKIGHLCDYILFDSAWLGYEQFISIMRDCSPLLLDLCEDSPGIIVTQSVHKQLAGFSQTSQIHKKDKHIKLQNRYCNHARFNNAFMLYASTSPFYPLFASLDVNAKIHSEGNGERIWEHCVRVGIEARKMIFSACEKIVPFVPSLIDGAPWKDYDTDVIASDLRFFEFSSDEKWHGFTGYGESQYFIDPCKLLLTTSRADAQGEDNEGFGFPAIVLAHYLRDQGIVPEKSDLYLIVFLLTPATSIDRLEVLVAEICRFECHVKLNSLLIDVIPSIYNSDPQRYHGYGVRDLCQGLSKLYSDFCLVRLQSDMFAECNFPDVVMSPYDANYQLVRGDVELIPLVAAAGRVAAEGVVPYPPGILCLAPGEVWGGAVLEYVLAAEQLMNTYPVLSPEIQGVHVKAGDDGEKIYYGYVVK